MSSVGFDYLLVSRILLAVLLHFVWQATLVFLCVTVVRISFARIHSTRYVSSVAGLILLLTLPMITAAIYVASPELVDVEFTAPAYSSVDPQLVSNSAIVPSRSGDLIQLSVSSLHQVYLWFDQLRQVWLSVWLLGFLLLGVRLLISLESCLKLRNSSHPIPAKMEQLSDAIKRKLSLSAGVIVRASEDVTQAIATGVLRPMVLIPAAWLTQLPPQSLEAIIAHELSHVRRFDLGINFLQRIAETVFFFHPLVWMLSKSIDREREICCDELAISCTGNRLAYAETLAWVAETKELTRSRLLFGHAFQGDKKMNLLRRVRFVLEPTAAEGPSLVRSFVVLMCVAGSMAFASLAFSVTAGFPAAVQDDHDSKRLKIIVEAKADVSQDHGHILIQRKDDHVANSKARYLFQIIESDQGKKEIIVSPAGDEPEHGHDEAFEHESHHAVEVDGHPHESHDHPQNVETVELHLSPGQLAESLRRIKPTGEKTIFFLRKQKEGHAGQAGRRIVVRPPIERYLQLELIDEENGHQENKELWKIKESDKEIDEVEMDLDIEFETTRRGYRAAGNGNQKKRGSLETKGQQPRNRRTSHGSRSSRMGAQKCKGRRSDR